jgi:hypothetical protein
MAAFGATDFMIWRGNSYAMARWQFLQDAETPLDLTGSEMVMRATWSGGSVRLTTASAANLVMDAEEGTLTWTPSITESRSIPEGRVAKYEIERRIGGEQRTLVQGYFVGVGGVNDDA